MELAILVCQQQDIFMRRKNHKAYKKTLHDNITTINLKTYIDI
jgi:hypothetical protein